MAGCDKALGDVAGAVVSEDGAGSDALACKPDHGSLQEGDGRVLALVGQDLGIGQTRPIIDADVDKLPADTASPTPVVAGDAMANGTDSAKLLDVEVQELARKLLFVATDRLGGLKRCQTTEASPLEDAGHRRAWQAETSCDLATGQTLMTKSHNLGDLLFGCLARHPARTGRPIHEIRRAFGSGTSQPTVR